MFICFIATTGFSFLRLCNAIYRLCLSVSVWLLRRQLSHRTGICFHAKIVYGRYQPDVILTADPINSGDWQPQFHFSVRSDKRGVLLYELKLPDTLRLRGHGSYCVKWLKNACRLFGLNFIVLGCYPEAAGFWRRMGFIATVYEDWKHFWN